MRPQSFTPSLFRAARDPGEPKERPNSGDDPPPSGRGDVFQEAAKNVLDLDQDEELAEGERQQSELLERYPLDERPATIQRLMTIHDRLSAMIQRSDLNYEFWALKSSTPFASSCCNGVVFFSDALLDSLEHDQALYIGAHEIVHTEFRHFASRGRRLEDLRRGIPGAPGSAARQRMEMTSVLAVRHLEEFEADHVAALWLGHELALGTLAQLHDCCRRTAPNALKRPTHPPFEARIARLSRRESPPEPISYLWSLIKG